MTGSERDERLDRAVGRARPGDLSVPDFGRWSEAHARDLAALRAGAVLGGRGTRLRGLCAAAAVLAVLGIGFVGGRLTGPTPPDPGQLQARVEASLKASLEAGCERIRAEILDQLHQDLGTLANRTLAASRDMTDQRLTELIRAIEAARLRDRSQVAAALEQVEINRLKDKVLWADGLASLAARPEDPGEETKTN